MADLKIVGFEDFAFVFNDGMAIKPKFFGLGLVQRFKLEVILGDSIYFGNAGDFIEFES